MLHPLFAGLLLAGCAAIQTTNAGQGDLHVAGIPQPCPDDFVRPTVPQVPPHCPADVFEEEGWAGCLTEDYMRRVIDAPAPSIETQLLWQSFTIKRRYDGDAYLDDLMAAIEAGKDTTELRRNDYYTNLSDHMVDFLQLHIRNQPPLSAEERTELRRHTLSNLIEVKGGTFQMGDFGTLIGEKIPYSSNPDNKPLHDVQLSDFAMLRHRVTFQDFDLYSRETGTIALAQSLGVNNRFKNIEANRLTWEQARGYCLWLGEQIDRPLDLPTEAQWEFAARSRGQLLPVATILPLEDVHEDTFKRYTMCRTAEHYPTSIGTYPPNELGFFEMVGHGDEWIRDWYSPDYYASIANQIAVDPTGPERGGNRVVRNASRHNWALTFTRLHVPPERANTAHYGISFRCATPPPGVP